MKKFLLYAILILSLLGAVVYLQLFVIEALCFFCLLSAITMILIFALSVVYNAKYSAEILGV